MRSLLRTNKIFVFSIIVLLVVIPRRDRGIQEIMLLDNLDISVMRQEDAILDAGSSPA